MIRPFEYKDLEEVKNLWKENNTEDVFLPDLINDENVRFRSVYEIDGKIVGFTCINLLPEIILVHNKSLRPGIRYKMLIDLLESNRRWAFGRNFKQVYAFLDNGKWIDHLKSVGFKLYEKGIYYLNLR